MRALVRPAAKRRRTHVVRPDGVSNRQGDCESIPPDAVSANDVMRCVVMKGPIGAFLLSGGEGS